MCMLIVQVYYMGKSVEALCYVHCDDHCKQTVKPLPGIASSNRYGLQPVLCVVGKQGGIIPPTILKRGLL